MEYMMLFMRTYKFNIEAYFASDYTPYDPELAEKMKEKGYLVVTFEEAKLPYDQIEDTLREYHFSKENTWEETPPQHVNDYEPAPEKDLGIAAWMKADGNETGADAVFSGYYRINDLPVIDPFSVAKEKGYKVLPMSPLGVDPSRIEESLSICYHKIH